MKRLRKARWVTICLITGVVLLGAVPAWALGDVYVSTTGSDTNGNGTSDKPYATIQKGIDEVDAGGTVNVAAGTYIENVNVTKSVTIDGQGTATLIAGIEYWTGKRGDGFRVTASDTTITGFTIIGHYGGVLQDFNNSGIIIGGNYPGDMAHLGVQRVTVSNNVFRDSWSAIYVWKSSDNLITGNTIYDMDWRAIQVYDGSSNSQIEEGYPSQNNRIIDNEVYDSWGGLYVGAWGAASMIRTDNSGTVIQGNYFHDLTDFAVGFGFTDSTNVDISGNTMENNPQGITVFWWDIANLTGTTVTGNTIDSNAYGILIGTCNQWTIEDNEITNNGYGIYVMQSAGIEAHHNNIVDNAFGVNNSIGDGESDQWVVDATCNWWGHPSGPSGVGTGSGDAVSEHVDYGPPWLLAPAPGGACGIWVQIDIKPGSGPNSINLKSKGVVPVAVLTTDDFDTTTVDPLSVKFGPNGATESHGRGHIEDVDDDGDLDLLLHFKMQELGLTDDSTEASLTGNTYGGTAIMGVDTVNIVPRGKKSAGLDILAVAEQLQVLPCPNPVRDVHTTTFRVMGAMASMIEAIRVRIFDLSGRLVWEDETVGNELDWHIENLVGEHLANGMYLYQVWIRIDGMWINKDIGKIAVLR